jgi:dTMP kinase
LLIVQESSASQLNLLGLKKEKMIPAIPSKTAAKPASRGAFIVLEGVDRCGKTTQASLLIKHLIGLGLAAVAMRFPDRTTMVGDLINQYLQSKSELDDRAVHLLFSANRWEAAPALRKTLIDDGANIICDRYAHSGVAFSSSKPSLEDNLDWCRACDVGLPAPDAIIFLDIAQEEAEQRGG